MMDKYLVTSDFIDKETGKVITARETIEVDDERAETLKAAGVIGKKVGRDKPRGKEKAGEPDGTQADNGAND